MYEETQYLQPQPGTDGTHPAWPTTPGVQMHVPKREERQMLRSYLSRRPATRVRVCFTFGEGSFSIIVRRVRGGGPPIGESGMKEDQ